MSKRQQEKPRVLISIEKHPLMKTSAQMTEWAEKKNAKTELVSFKVKINSGVLLSSPIFFFSPKTNLAERVMQLTASIPVFSLSSSFFNSWY